MPPLDKQMEADALEAMKLARKFFVVELDFTEQSVQQLEEQFDAVDYALSGGVSEENIQLLKRIWGGYLGEAIRRNCGGQWTTTRDESGADVPAILCRGDSFFPHQQVYLRLVEGPQHNIWQYYQALKEPS